MEDIDGNMIEKEKSLRERSVKRKLLDEKKSERKRH